MCVSTDSIFIDGSQFGGLVDCQARLFLPWYLLDPIIKTHGLKIGPEDLKERHDRIFEPVKSKQEKTDCPVCRPIRGRPSSRYRPAKNDSLARKADRRYYKLASGNILDIESKTILNREALKALLGS